MLVILKTTCLFAANKILVLCPFMEAIVQCLATALLRISDIASRHTSSNKSVIIYKLYIDHIYLYFSHSRYSPSRATELRQQMSVPTVKKVQFLNI